METLKMIAALVALLVLCTLMGVACLGRLAGTTGGMIASPLVGLVFVAVIVWTNRTKV